MIRVQKKGELILAGGNRIICWNEPVLYPCPLMSGFEPLKN
jgi:hypothetical protein